MTATVSRRRLLARAAVWSIALFSGCSGVWRTPDTPRTTETTAEPTDSSPTPEPAHPVHLSLENESDADRTLSVRITETSGEVVLAETYALAGREELTVEDALPAPTGEPVTYVVTASLENGARTEETITVRVHADVTCWGSSSPGTAT